MSNKNLLNESTIRKFMKLASIEPLASDFISKIQEGEKEERPKTPRPVKEEEEEKPLDEQEIDEAELEEVRNPPKSPKKPKPVKEEEDVEEGMHPKMKADDELDEEFDLEEMGGTMYKDDDDMGAAMGMDADRSAGKMVDLDKFLDILEKAVEEFLGEPTEIERDMDDDDMDGDDMDDMDDMKGMGDMGDDPELEEAEEEEKMEEAEHEKPKKEDLAEAIYQEVLKRISQKK